MAVTKRDSDQLALTTSAADVGVVVPTAKVRVYTMIQVANVDGTNAADATVQWLNSSNSNAVTRLAFGVPVKAKDSLSVAAGALILAAGDKLQALASANSDLEITASYYEEDV